MVSFQVPGAPDLKGKWNSSLKLSNQFNVANQNYRNKDINDITHTIGKISIAYNEGAFVIIENDKSIYVNGKKHELKGARIEFKYTIISSSENEIILNQVNTNNEVEKVILHFVDGNTYWVYVGKIKKFDSLNTREYFVKVKESKGQSRFKWK